ncbi:mRNA interferase RelE/StbE [Gammaproteobacteria bacterium]
MREKLRVPDMLFNIEFKPRAIKDLNALPSETGRRIMDKIERLKTDLSGDVKRLTHHTPEYRLRVGDYRVLFEVEQQTLMVYRIVHRREAYR